MMTMVNSGLKGLKSTQVKNQEKHCNIWWGRARITYRRCILSGRSTGSLLVFRLITCCIAHHNQITCNDPDKLWSCVQVTRRAGGGGVISKWAQDMCITFVQRRPDVEDVGPTLYKCYTHVLCLLREIRAHHAPGEKYSPAEKYDK